MTTARWTAGVMLAGLLSAVAAAQDDAPPGPLPGGSPDGAQRSPAVELFDVDGDGALNDDEIGRARSLLQELRSHLGERMRQRRGERDAVGERDGDAPRGDRARDGRTERGGDRRLPRAADEARGPAAPPRGEPMRLFGRFDADGNGELNRDEFSRLMGEIGDRRGPGGPPEGRRFGPGGPPDGLPGPPEGRPDGRRFRRPPTPPEGDRGPEADRPAGPPTEAGDADRDGPPPRRFRPRDGDRGRRPPRDDAATDLPEAPRYEAPAADDGV